jgi:acyl phosphate:glycerol-3-phosphate acyltransferase
MEVSLPRVRGWQHGERRRYAPWRGRVHYPKARYPREGVVLLEVFLTILFMVMGYLLGSIPTGYLVARARGVDIQRVGSGNIGATNILRTLGLGAALVVMVLDPFKGFLAVTLPILFGMTPWTVALAGLAAVLGNNFNVFLQLKGGKGIATGLGVLLGVEPLVTLLVVVLGVTVILLSRYVSLGSLVGVLSAPLFLLARGDFLFPYLFMTLCIALLAFYRHRDNILRLQAGSERRLGERSLPREPT